MYTYAGKYICLKLLKIMFQLQNNIMIGLLNWFTNEKSLQ